MITEQQIEAAGNALIALGCNVPYGAIKAALEAADKAAWQPIDTAPKDGNQALFYTKGNPNAWNDYAKEEQCRVDFWYNKLNCFFKQLPEANYTHWRPLPEPPKE